MPPTTEMQPKPLEELHPILKIVREGPSGQARFTASVNFYGFEAQNSGSSKDIAYTRALANALAMYRAAVSKLADPSQSSSSQPPMHQAAPPTPTNGNAYFTSQLEQATPPIDPTDKRLQMIGRRIRCKSGSREGRYGTVVGLGKKRDYVMVRYDESDKDVAEDPMFLEFL